MSKLSDRTNLTPLFVAKKLAPGMYYDQGETRQLALHVRSSGSKSWVVYRRWPGSGKPARRKIADAGEMSLAEARQVTRDWCGKAARNIDPAMVAARERETTFEAVCEAYFAEEVHPKHRRARRTEQEIRRELIPVLGSRPIVQITAQDILALVRTIVRSGRETTAHHMLGHAKQVFKWAFHEGSRFGLMGNPAKDVDPKATVGESRRTRERVLTDAELRSAWLAAEKLGYPTGSCIRWIMLTGCRRQEAAGMQWSEIDTAKRLWTIPAARFKSDRVHTVPLSPPAMALIEAAPRHSGPHVFTTTLGRIGLNGWSKAKDDLDDLAGIEAGFTLHDIRRTVRTRMSALRIPKDIAEACLGHQTQTKLEKTYDRHDPIDQKRKALDAWARLLVKIVDPKQSPKNVVDLDARRSG